MNIAEGNKPVAGNIKKIIYNNAYHQPAIAERAGISARNLWDMLNGTRIIRPADLQNIAMALDVSVEELFAEDTDTDSQTI